MYTRTIVGYNNLLTEVAKSCSVTFRNLKLRAVFYAKLQGALQDVSFELTYEPTSYNRMLVILSFYPLEDKRKRQMRTLELGTDTFKHRDIEYIRSAVDAIIKDTAYQFNKNTGVDISNQLFIATVKFQDWAY